MVVVHRRARHSLAALLALVLLLIPITAGTAGAQTNGPGMVYTLSNSASGNEVLAFTRSADGSLTFAQAYPTGGQGTGMGLGSQGALVMSHDGRWLFAVNAGSNSVTVFRVQNNTLRRVSTTPSGGTMPISVTHSGRLVYVLNAGGAGNITGFQLSNDGRLTMMPNATRSLSNGGSGAGVGPAQVEFTPDGRWLVVTEKMTNMIDVFQVQKNGMAGDAIVSPSAGMTPFGFEFGKRGLLIVSEAFGGAPDASATSSYRINGDGTLSVISASVPTTETAACWVVVSKDGRYAYVTNTGSASVSGYGIAGDGMLSLLNADGVTGMSGDGPIDAALSNNGQFLYTLNSMSGNISIFMVNAGGSLTDLGETGNLPPSAVGMAAR